MINEYPIFVISYNRAKNHITSRKLADFGVHHYLILHKEQIQEYKKHFSSQMERYTHILEFDDSYKLKYETCDNIPHSVKNAGSGAERNFAWDYSIKLGAKAHWLMDDNMNFRYIAGINKENNSYVRRVCTGEKFRELFHKAEIFFNKYENLLMIELAQNDFTIGINKKCYRLNTRCFSCNLISNIMPIRWRGRYNEDVILSFDIMTAGYCIASYIGGVLKAKESTRCARGGNHATNELDKNSLYDDSVQYRNSSIDKTNLLLQVYPKYFKKVIKYGRVHHTYNKSIIKADFPQTLKLADLSGVKKINIKDFNKIKHYPIPKGV